MGHRLIPIPINKSSVFLILPLRFLFIRECTISIACCTFGTADPIHPEHQCQVITVPKTKLSSWPLQKTLSNSWLQDKVPILYLTFPAFSPRPLAPGWTDSRTLWFHPLASKKNHQTLPIWIHKAFSQLQPLATFLTLNSQTDVASTPLLTIKYCMEPWIESWVLRTPLQRLTEQPEGAPLLLKSESVMD